jgi:hypothetical protein
MFQMPIESRSRMSSSVFHLLEFVGKPLPFPAPLDLCRDQVPASASCDGLRFADAAAKSESREAFRPAFATGDWRVFASYCIARRLPAQHRVVMAGPTDRTLRFLVEGRLQQEVAGAAAKVLLPGAMLGEDTLFSDSPCEREVRTLEPTLILELSLSRQKEMTAACPEIGFEMLRAAGAVIAARGRGMELADEAANG